MGFGFSSGIDHMERVYVRGNWRVWAFAFALVLAGCAPQEEEDDHGYGSAYDGRTELWIRYRFISENLLLTGLIDDALVSAASCLGTEVMGQYDLLVVFDDEIDHPYWEAFFSDSPPLIVVEPQEHYLSTIALLEHEMVHFLVWLDTGDVDANHNIQCYPHGTIDDGGLF